MTEVCRVFVCDDDQDTAALLEAWFADRADLEVVGCNQRAAECVEQISELQPDVVVLDHLMPGAPSSAHTIAELRAANVTARVAIYSGLTTDLLEHEATAAGADAALSKDMEREELCRRLCELAALPPR